MGKEFLNTTLGSLIAVQASRYPDRIYLQVGDQRWTYRQVDEQASSLAASLLELGLSAGERLALILPNVPDFVISVYAAAKAGLILVPINMRRSPTEVLARLSRTQPHALITSRNGSEDHLIMVNGLRSNLPSLEHVISTDGNSAMRAAWEQMLTSNAKLPEVAGQPRDPAAIIHTLGSSGEPRGAVLTHRGLVGNAAAMVERLQATEDDVFLGAVPFSNTFGLTTTILTSAIAGARLICMPHFNPRVAQAVIALEQVTIQSGVPTLFAMELNQPDFDRLAYTSLRTGIMAGAPCPPELVARVHQAMNCRVLIGYGLTEAAPAVTMTHLDDGPVTATQTVGRPLDGVTIKVCDPDGESLPIGSEGELCVQGYNVMLGYWEDPTGTAEVLDADGWLHTGDLAVIDPDGPVRIVGRIHEVIMRSGLKIHPGTVEMALRAHPAVRECAVVGIPDLIYGELIVACVVCDGETELIHAELEQHCKTYLPDYAQPDRIQLFDILPRDSRGQPRKDFLRERVRIRGRAFKFGKNIDTDAIIPARRCNTADPRELALYAMEDADPQFVHKMQRGDLIVADSNFGCGSSREVAPLAIKAAGVSAVVAKSFARIFFRNAINIGLPILECPEAINGINERDEVEVEPATGIIRNLTTGAVYRAEPFPDFLQRIIDRGGLLAYVEERLATQ